MLKCEVKRCRRDWDLTYLGRRVCRKHFESWCEKGKPNLKQPTTYKRLTY